MIDLTTPTAGEWRPEVRPCPVCAETAHVVLGIRGGHAHHAGRGQASTIVRCRRCHAVYPNPRLIPTGNPYASHSSDEYFRVHDPSVKEESGRRLSQHAALILGRRGRLLDLGCGRGELLIGASREGWAVRGVEMTEPFARATRANGIDVELARVEDCRSLDESWDVVFVAAILEHLYEPRECLKRIFSALRPGGIVFVDVPNECSLWTRLGNAYMRLRGRPWAVNLSPTFPPYHVTGFCPRALRFIAAEVGFQVVEFRTHRWRNELPRRNSAIGRIEHLGSGVVLRIGAWLGSGAGITAWLRRPLGPGSA